MSIWKRLPKPLKWMRGDILWEIAQAAGGSALGGKGAETMTTAPWWGWALLLFGLWLLASTFVPKKAKRGAAAKKDRLALMGLLIQVCDRAVLNTRRLREEDKDNKYRHPTSENLWTQIQYPETLARKITHDMSLMKHVCDTIEIDMGVATGKTALETEHDLERFRERIIDIKRGIE